MPKKLIYMDCCCLNRSNDDQKQDKIRIETDVILAILKKCENLIWELVVSDVLLYEIMKNQNPYTRNKTLMLFAIAQENISLDNKIVERAKEMQKYGIKEFDSLHFALAEYKKVDVLLSVDKDFIKHSKQIKTNLIVDNPINWYIKELEND
ncbi:MAG: type II toxin-antitoxin system VapC family toxin [Bacteroidetes bacterium]|nr:type II toxin-antitoxin system VapC family toxin [Bacteroidota bacterium]